MPAALLEHQLCFSLWEQDERAVGVVAARFGVESGTVTPLVKRLGAAGLVTRLRDPKGERQVHVYLTRHGAALHKKCDCLAEALVERLGMAGERLALLNKDVQSSAT